MLKTNLKIKDVNIHSARHDISLLRVRLSNVYCPRGCIQSRLARWAACAGLFLPKPPKASISCQSFEVLAAERKGRFANLLRVVIWNSLRVYSAERLPSKSTYRLTVTLT
jgi:hypothetical protein